MAIPRSKSFSKAVVKSKFYCKNGPLAHVTLMLSTGLTLVMTIKGQTGRYRYDRTDGYLTWEPYDNGTRTD